jgi:hypothetical protein
MCRTALMLWAAHSILHSEFRFQATTHWSYVAGLGHGQSRHLELLKT